VADLAARAEEVMDSAVKAAWGEVVTATAAKAEKAMEAEAEAGVEGEQTVPSRR